MKKYSLKFKEVRKIEVNKNYTIYFDTTYVYYINYYFPLLTINNYWNLEKGNPRTQLQLNHLADNIINRVIFDCFNMTLNELELQENNDEFIVGDI